MKINAIPVSVSINKVVLEYGHAHSLVYCPWLPFCHRGRDECLQQRLKNTGSLAFYSKSSPTSDFNKTLTAVTLSFSEISSAHRNTEEVISA